MKSKYISWGSAWLLCLMVFSLLSCKKDDEVNPSPQVSNINTFIWDNMNEAYLWKEQIPQNIDPKTESDPEQLFQKLLNKPADRWSFITDDYEGLVNRLKGIEETFGHQFKLFLLPGTNDVVGIVQYVVPNSPADRAGIVRGDKFYKVDGQTLLASNYQKLLFDRTSYMLTMGEFDNEGIIKPLAEKTLTAEVLAENPILIHKSVEVEGKTIGYLAYNQFIMEYDDSLVNVFTQFQQEGITDLVLDLRYNPGGSINTAILLSSLIAPSAAVNNKEIFAKMLWNDILTKEIIDQDGEDSDNLISRFVTPNVNLNLGRVYVLVSKSTASASELLINCLRPYMDVVLIGSENTTGKYVGSITIHDEQEAPGWAMQPIVLKTANVNGISDFVDGFAPDYIVKDDFNAELGTLQEDMFARGVELITGISISEPARTTKDMILRQLEPLSESTPVWKKNMYLEWNFN